jgi:hypothetical protein
MSERELATFEGLPDSLVLFRACRISNKWGLCWRLGPDGEEVSRAARQATEDDPALLVTARARKDQVAAVKIEPQRVAIIAMRPRHLTTSKLKA